MKRHYILQFHVKIWHRLVRNSSRSLFSLFSCLSKESQKSCKNVQNSSSFVWGCSLSLKKEDPQSVFSKKDLSLCKEQTIKNQFSWIFREICTCTIWKSRQNHNYCFYGKINIFSSNHRFVTKELISRKFLSVIELKHCTVWKKCKIICESDLHYISGKTADKIMCETDITNFFQVIQQQSTFYYYK